MRGDSVTYRIGASGERDVLDTLAKIAAGGDSSAKKLGQAYDRELRTAEAAIERLQRKADALKVLGGSAVQRQIAESTGLAAGELGASKSAEASMRVFVQQQDELARARERLIQQADPLAAAQMRYNATMAEAVRLDREGALAQGDLTRIHASAKAELDRLGGSFDPAAKSANAFRYGLQNAGFQISDFAVQVGAGTSATRAFALQGPQLIQAIAMMGSGAGEAEGKFAKFANFMSTGWGAAITVAVSIAGALASKLLDNESAADKATKAHETLADKLDLEKHSFEEVLDAMREYNAEQEKSRVLTLDGAKAVAAKAAADLNAAIAIREKIKAMLDEQNATLTSGKGFGIEGAGAAAAGAADTAARLAEQDAAIAVLTEGARNAVAGVATEIAKINTDGRYAIEQRFERLRNAARASVHDVDALTKRLTDLANQEKSALQTYDKAHRAGSSSGSGQYGREIDLDEAKSIAAGAGLRVTSGFRTRAEQQYLYDHARTAQNPVARPGTSAHERGNALDIAFGPGVTPASIKKAYEEGGVRLTKILKETGHFHIEWSTTGVDKQFREAQQAEKELADERERNVDSARKLIEAGDPFLVITNKLKDELAEIDRLSKTSPAQGGIGSEQADILRQQAEGRAFNARMAEFSRQHPGYGEALDEADRAYAQQREQQRSMLADQAQQNRMLDAELSLVRASSFERDRQLSQLDLMAQLKDRGIDLESEATKEILRGHDALLLKGEALRQENALWEEQRRTGEQIIDTVFDPQNWKDWGDIGLSVIRMLITEMLTLATINPLKNMLFGSGLPTLGAGGIGGFLGGLFGGGKSGGVGGAILDISSAFGHASGTEWADGGWRRVGEFGEELVRLPRGSQVINAGRTRAMNRATARPVPANITINAPGADAAALARVEMAVRELNDSIEQRAIGAVVDYNDRTFGMGLRR